MRVSFFVVAGGYCHVGLYEKAGAGFWVLGVRTLYFFSFCCGKGPCHVRLYESLTNMLKLKDFHFSLWQVFTAM